MALDIQKEFESIRAMYKKDPRQGTFNALILGKSGTGKTNCLKTCRAPVLLHSFDPGGSKTIRDEIATGRILCDTRFETEDPRRPTAYNMWENEFRKLRDGKFFDNIGTYCIDSLTTFSDALIHEMLNRAKRAGQPMQKQDWGAFLNGMMESVNSILNLPCDVIITGHLAMTTDDVTGRGEAGILIGGQSKDRLPILFDEVYIATAQETAKAIEYKFITANTGFYNARTRIGAGKFSTYEEPNIKALLKKAGMPCEDKPLLN